MGLACAITYEMLTGKLPYVRGFANARDVAQLEYVAAGSLRPDVPLWMDAALRQGVAKKPAERTEALSALTANLAQPNPDLRYDRQRPLYERDPVAFWRAAAIALAVLNVVLLFQLSR